MKNKQRSNFLKVALCLFLIQSFTIQTIPTAHDYKEYFHKLNGVQYADNCSLINIAQHIRGAGLLAYYRGTHKKANLDQALSVIQTQLTEFETWLLTLEKNALIAIKEKYSVSDDIWQNCLTDIRHIKNSHKNGMLLSHSNIIHDPNVPDELTEMLTTLLKENGINPQSIHFKMINHQKDNTSEHCIAQARSFITCDTHNNFTIFYDYIPSIIEIYPPMINKSITDKMSFCAHEIQHLLQHHALTELVLTQYLEHYYNVDTAAFKKTKEYLTLSQIHEAQAEVLSAIKSPKIAECFKSMRAKNYYPNHLYEEHFCDLSSIDTLWKVHGWLEFIQQDGLIKVRNEWFDTIKKCGNSLKQLLITT